MKKTSKKIISLLVGTSVMLSTSLPTVSALEEATCVATKKADIEHYLDHQAMQYSSEILTDSTLYDSFYYEDIYVCISRTNSSTYEYAYNLNGIVHSKKFVDGKLISEESSTPFTTHEISTEEINTVESLLRAYNQSQDFSTLSEALALSGFEAILHNDGSISVQKISPLTRAAQENLTFGIEDCKEAFPPLNNKLSSSRSFYCTPLGVNKSVNIRDGRTSYTEKKYRSGTFLSGSSVAVAAASLLCKPASILNLLGLSLSVSTFPYDVFIHRTTEVVSYHYRNADIYDSVRKKNVIVLTEYGDDYFIVSNQGNGYQWGVEPSPVDELYPDDYMADKAAKAYNSAVELYGYWKWD